ncbi:hypothetical protein HRR83_004567 [Exophiala dermatitidis]|nr:hypothetical protein HRR75_003803 [Exophiala dermatitidis]KAJ4519408.1 hypothetical protein HRR74_004151 [Exophiala dermatitidis]KAJ4529224.1 hypothetical protein HRR73_000246 [Exophiala dermatitidis]KAJ4544128.1 hypothetical protein HRR76_002195 [Exophiala dermatitidis]KAJ4549309.1 hypothetical protein HRR77_004175 [Exophiala dermatitidis]
MTSDDQQFLDLLASIPQDMAHYGSRIADYIDKYTDALASGIRDAIDHSSWVPDALRPPPRPGSGPGAFFARAQPLPQSYLDKATAWISKNRMAIAIVVAFAGTSVYLVHRRKKEHARKRRVRKLPNGAKKEIVVLACSTFHDPLTRSLALDLERRGYVVYVTVSSTEEDSLVQQESKTDLRPLWIDLTSTVPNPAVDIHPNLEPIRELLKKSSPSSTPQRNRSAQGSSMGNMTLAGIIVFPGCSGYPEGPLPLLPPSDVVDTINTRLVSPLLTVQQFLPLLANNSTDPKSPSSIVVAYPSIPNSLSPPRQVPECLVTSSLSALASSLRREIHAAKANITVTELKLGNFDMGSVPSSRTAYSQPPPPGSSHYNSSATSSQAYSSSALTHWHSSQRAALQRKSLGQRSLIRGSSAREFHNAVFDALAPPQTFKAFGRFEWTATHRPQVVFVGSGARLYDIAGRILPDGLVAYMMGYRRKEHEGSGMGLGIMHQHQQRNEPSFAGEQQPDSSSQGHHEREGAATGTPSAAAAATAPTWGFGSTGSESGVWEKL